jgi:hypothetical protein
VAALRARMKPRSRRTWPSRVAGFDKSDLALFDLLLEESRNRGGELQALIEPSSTAPTSSAPLLAVLRRSRGALQGGDQRAIAGQELRLRCWTSSPANSSCINPEEQATHNPQSSDQAPEALHWWNWRRPTRWHATAIKSSATACCRQARRGGPLRAAEKKSRRAGFRGLPNSN